MHRPQSGRVLRGGGVGHRLDSATRVRRKAVPRKRDDQGRGDRKASAPQPLSRHAARRIPTSRMCTDTAAACARCLALVAPYRSRCGTCRVGRARGEVDCRRRTRGGDLPEWPTTAGHLTRRRLDALGSATGFRSADVHALAGRHVGSPGLPRLRAALDLCDPGAKSPSATWLRLLVERAGFPRPRTQIPVCDANGRPIYRIDMGWGDVLVAVEDDGDHHRERPQFAGTSCAPSTSRTSGGRTSA